MDLFNSHGFQRIEAAMASLSCLATVSRRVFVISCPNGMHMLRHPVPQTTLGVSNIGTTTFAFPPVYDESSITVDLFVYIVCTGSRGVLVLTMW